MELTEDERFIDRSLVVAEIRSSWVDERSCADIFHYFSQVIKEKRYEGSVVSVLFPLNSGEIHLTGREREKIAIITFSSKEVMQKIWLGEDKPNAFHEFPTQYITTKQKVLTFKKREAAQNALDVLTSVYGIKILRETHCDITIEAYPFQITFLENTMMKWDIERNHQPSQPTYASGGSQTAAYKVEPMSYRCGTSTIHVMIYDIKKMHVDAIVNSARNDLVHTRGVALAISEAAGPILSEECTKFIKTNGELRVTETSLSSAGRLPCKNVIHAVGPNWYVSNGGHESCFSDFVNTIENCLRTADIQSYQTLAIPLIGAGLCQQPKKYADKLISAVVNHLTGDTQLKHVFFVDVQHRMINHIQKECNKNERLQLCQSFCGHMHIPRHTVCTRPQEQPKHKKPPSTTETKADAEKCVICMENIKISKKLTCGHEFCEQCIDECFKRKPVCPMCGHQFGLIKGTQPDNCKMTHQLTTGVIPGIKEQGVIVIDYNIPNGIQSRDHPNSGVPYKGTRRRAFLPNNNQGHKVLRLLKRAFDQKLIFTIGRSSTTGREDAVTWNDIHHKTSISGGPANFGYPDPTYIDRVTAELGAKGITEDSDS